MEFPTILGFHLDKQWDPVFLLLSTFLTSLNSSSKIFLASMVALDFPNIKTCLPHKLGGTEFICQACSKYNSSRQCGSASSALQYLNTLLVQADTTERQLAQAASRKLPPGQIPPQDKFQTRQVPPGQAPEQIYDYKNVHTFPNWRVSVRPSGAGLGKDKFLGRQLPRRQLPGGDNFPPDKVLGAEASAASF